MDKAVDPNGGFIINIFLHSRAACAAGDSALHVLGFDEQETADLQSFISEVLGPADPLIELWQSSNRTLHPHGALAFVLKLSARSERTWKIIFIHLPKVETETMGRALGTLVPTLRLHTWPREAIARGDDLFWWDDEAREWRACPLFRGF